MLLYIFHFIVFFFGGSFQKYLCKHGYLSPQLWSIYGSIHNFNIAVPDGHASYRGSFVCLNDNETLTLESTVPHARYYSVQMYDSKTSSLGSLNDHQINTQNDKFAITISKSKNCISNKNVLCITTENSFLILVYRVYDIYPINCSNLDNCQEFGHLYMTFGWIEPPKIKRTSVNYIDHVKSHVLMKFPRVHIDGKPIREHKFANQHNNFFKPITNAFFANDDASYLVSLIQVNTTKIGAIITGILPKTYPTVYVTHIANKNKSIDYFKNNNNISTYDSGYYEVKYASFSIGITSGFMPTIGGNMLHSKFEQIDPRDVSSNGTPTLRDIDILSVNGSNYKIYVGMDIEHIKEMGANIEKDLYMIYPKSYITNKHFTYVVIVYRHLMPQSKFLKNPLFKQSIHDILNPPAIPSECEQVMKKYYPNIKFIT